MSNMRHNQRTLRTWIRPEQAFLKPEILVKLKEYDIYGKKDYKN